MQTNAYSKWRKRWPSVGQKTSKVKMTKPSNGLLKL